jgi:hypothetical protein
MTIASATPPSPNTGFLPTFPFSRFDCASGQREIKRGPHCSFRIFVPHDRSAAHRHHRSTERGGPLLSLITRVVASSIWCGSPAAEAGSERSIRKAVAAMAARAGGP